MTLKCTKRNFSLSDYGNYFFTDTEGKNYWWGTKSDKAYELMQEGSEVEVTSFKLTGSFESDGVEYACLKDVRFKEVTK
jgi:hypothetical protein